MNGALLYYECRLSCGDTQTLPALIDFVITGGGEPKTSTGVHSSLCVPDYIRVIF